MLGFIFKGVGVSFLVHHCALDHVQGIEPVDTTQIVEATLGVAVTCENELQLVPVLEGDVGVERDDLLGRWFDKRGFLDLYVGQNVKSALSVLILGVIVERPDMSLVLAEGKRADVKNGVVFQ